MKRLLLFLMLSPVILLAQTGRKDDIDSIAAINLQSLPASLSNNLMCTKVADLRITDNGEYTTIVVFLHIIAASDSADKVDIPTGKTDTVTPVNPLSVVTINTDDMLFAKADILTYHPPLPVVAINAEDNPVSKTDITALSPIALVTVNTEDIPIVKVEMVTSVPSLPIVQGDTITALSPLAVVTVNTEVIAVGKVDMITTIPSLPIVQGDTITALSPVTLVTINIEAIPVSTMDIAANIPPLPFVQPDTIAALPPLAVVTINTEDISVSKADIAANIPPLPFVQPDSIALLTPLAVVALNTENIPLYKVDIIETIPPLPFVQPDSIPLLTPLAEVALNTENVPLYKEEVVVPIPKIEEKRMPVAEMHLSPDGYSLLQKLEGFSPELYSLNDGGFTIGFGFFVSYSEGAKWKKGITWEEAEQMIRQKMPAYEDQVKEYINIPLTQNEFDALTMLAYNLGGFSKATSIINDINNQVGFDKIQSDWKRFVHSKAPGVTKGLMNRRRDELEVRSISEYQPDRKIQILKK